MITKDYKEEHELVRKELWMRIACAYVNSSNSTSISCGGGSFSSSSSSSIVIFNKVKYTI